MQRKIVLIVFLAVILSLDGFISLTAGAETNWPGEEYVCPSCGCGNDDHVYDKAGLCPVCGMKLVLKSSLNAPTTSAPQREAERRRDVADLALMAQGNPLSADVKRDYKSVRDYFIRAAEKMPEADYGFRPSPDVRSFAQQVAHVADDQYNLCAPAKGEIRKAAYTDIEDRLSKKADLVPALKEAFAYCDGAYDALTDASGAEIVKSNKGGRTRFSMLNWNLWHTWEHYGNVVVYLRMKGLVPPSSEKTQTK